MFIALVLLNICHPGRIMPGKESDFPSRKVRKAMGKIKSGNSISPASDGVVRLDNFPNSVGNGDLEETMKPTIERHHRVSDIWVMNHFFSRFFTSLWNQSLRRTPLAWQFHCRSYWNIYELWTYSYLLSSSRYFDDSTLVADGIPFCLLHLRHRFVNATSFFSKACALDAMSCLVCAMDLPSQHPPPLLFRYWQYQLHDVAWGKQWKRAGHSCGTAHGFSLYRLCWKIFWME